MTRTDAQKELERIEQELNAEAAPPADESRIQGATESSRIWMQC